MVEPIYRTTLAVWELTLKCNLACRHCGSWAGKARAGELSTAEALDLVGQLAEVGIDTVTLIGGEAYLRADWLTIAAAIHDAGMACSVVSGGFGISAATVRRMCDAGISLVCVSVDGLEATHDELRGRAGSWGWCFRTMEHVRTAGLEVACTTQINRLSAPELPRLYELVRDAGVRVWQLQLTNPMGNAADEPALLLQPPELLDLFPVLARVAWRAARDGMRFAPANNIGYYGPYERLFRSQGHAWGFWLGPDEGLTKLGIEADGTIKPDPTLLTLPYAAGNIRERRLREIITRAPAFQLNLGAGSPEGTAHLWGFCKTCEFAELCRGGDPWTAHVYLGRRGNNAHCYHRAATLRRMGRRERLEPVTVAVGKPFDYRTFAIVEEPCAAPWPTEDSLHFTADTVDWPPDWPEESEAAACARPSGTAATAQGRAAATAPECASAGSEARPWRQANPYTNPTAVLPRRAWADPWAFLRSAFRTKRALDAAEDEAKLVPGPQVSTVGS